MEYNELKNNQIELNTTATNAEIMGAIEMRESWIKETFWALSNLTAGSPTVLEQFLDINIEYGNGRTAFDKLVEVCYLSTQIVPHKKLFVESLFALCNFLTEASEEQLRGIRNDSVTELLVYCLVDSEIIMQIKQGKDAVENVLEALLRLMKIDWSEFMSNDIGFSRMVNQFEELGGRDHVERLKECQNEDIEKLAAELIELLA